MKDKPDGFAVCGLAYDDFTATIQNRFSQTIRSVLEPTSRFRVASLVLDGATIGVIYVEPHMAKPVIVSKDEGAIYYRYPGETKSICYPDLRAILDERAWLSIAHPFSWPSSAMTQRCGKKTGR